MGRLFGTDGVRGVANSELTPELAFKLGKAGAHVLSKKKGKPVVLIGKDTRISGDMLEDALSAGILAVGGNVIKVGVLPTPAVAYLVKYYQADVGVVISASHNPFEYNGIKFFNSEGFKLDDEIEDEIEDLILRDIARVRDILDRTERGETAAHYQTGHPHGYIDAMYRGELAAGKALYARDQSFTEMKERAEVYPEELRRALISFFMFEAKFSCMLAEGNGRGGGSLLCGGAPVPLGLGPEPGAVRLKPDLLPE